MKVLYSILFAVVVLPILSNAALLGSERCTHDPSYWCQHLGTVKECNAVEFCSRKWRAMEMPAGQAVECEFCQLIMTDLRQEMEANKTQEEIRRAVNLACDLVHDARMSQLCKSVIDSYLPELLQLLERELDPKKICAALSLCGSPATRFRDPKLKIRTLPRVSLTKSTAPLLLRGAPRLPAGALCSDCERVMNDVKKAVEDKKAQQEIEAMIKQQVCEQLGPLKDECSALVDQYLPEILALLDQNIDAQQICIILQFCSNDKLQKLRAHPILQLMELKKSNKQLFNNVECELCEALVTEARQLIRNNKTEAEIIQFIRTRVCSIVPAEKDKCIRAITEYGPIIFQLLASELDPVTVCQALGACGKTTRRQPVQPAGATPQCIMCEFVLRELTHLIGDNKTEASIESALRSVCSILPRTVRADCNSFVHQYTPVIVHLLANEISPAVVCSSLGLCSAGQRQVRQFSSPAACDLCQTVISYAKALLTENSTEQEVVMVLQKVCNFLPDAERPECRNYVANYGPLLINLLAQELSPNQICRAVGVCQKANSASSSRLYYRHRTPIRRVRDPEI